MICVLLTSVFNVYVNAFINYDTKVPQEKTLFQLWFPRGSEEYLRIRCIFKSQVLLHHLLTVQQITVSAARRKLGERDVYQLLHGGGLFCHDCYAGRSLCRLLKMLLILLFYVLQDPEVMAAFQDVAQNPANMSKYQNNPKVMSLISKLSAKFGSKP